MYILGKVEVHRHKFLNSIKRFQNYIHLLWDFPAERESKKKQNWFISGQITTQPPCTTTSAHPQIKLRFKKHELTQP